MITMERVPVLVKLLHKFKGPISVALHISSQDNNKLQHLEKLYELHKSDEYVAQFLDLHLIIDKFDRQFNMWRNVARLFARTEYVMNMDVDFFLCTDLRANVDRF
jgi:hypothetical protein